MDAGVTLKLPRYHSELYFERYLLSEKISGRMNQFSTIATLSEITLIFHKVYSFPVLWFKPAIKWDLLRFKSKTVSEN